MDRPDALADRMRHLVHAFAQGALEARDWDEAAQILVILYYVRAFGFPEALPVLRSGVQRIPPGSPCPLDEAHLRFFVAHLAGFVDAEGPDLSAVELARRLLARAGPGT